MIFLLICDTFAGILSFWTNYKNVKLLLSLQIQLKRLLKKELRTKVQNQRSRGYSSGVKQLAAKLKI